MERRRLLLATAGLAATAGCLFDDGLAGNGSDDGELDGHERGELEIVIDGTPVDLSADRFQAEHADDYSIDFHLHEFDDYWYMEGDERVTFAEAIDFLPHFSYDRDDGNHVVTYDDTTYDGADGTELTFVRNGDVVDPTDHELYDGDDLRLEITTDA
ncbi:hypothetical protein [Natrarchaeobius oligotrophus]|uniref:Uncharacterized protein n=1 Tax=Natrarchaeobius chitinivorans TaxID=1679083 RepID=A0A3N6MIC4_NATCH|nr:hypothetical protein [Natrarchaeobius chitinivorans]RQH00905.1 hypothetical protein EA472_09790 [Natrarchaeobius chitinivorans]